MLFVEVVLSLEEPEHIGLFFLGIHGGLLSIGKHHLFSVGLLICISIAILVKAIIRCTTLILILRLALILVNQHVRGGVSILGVVECSPCSSATFRH
jgi:hypothetical protein